MKFETASLNQSRVILSRSRQEKYIRDGRCIPKPELTPEVLDRDALATLIYSSVVLPPRTIFKEYSALCMGGTLELGDDGEWQYREVEDVLAQVSCEDKGCFDAIEDLAESLSHSGVDFENVALFLSEGKDSVGIALAFAELGVKVNCFTFANSDTNIGFVENLARQLGHPHRVFRYSDFSITDETLSRFARVFEPTLDQAFLSYLLLPTREFTGRTLIDGSGNDVYMGHLPTKHQRRATSVCDAACKLVPRSVRWQLQSLVCNDHAFTGLPLRSFSECQGLFNGFSEKTVAKSVGGAVEHLSKINKQWRRIGFERARALCRGRHLVNYCFNGKSVSLAEMAGAKAWFPWTDTMVASKYLQLPDRRRFEWPKKNKLPLRDAISRRLSYSQPKVGFRAPTEQIISSNRKLFEHSIESSIVIGPELKQLLSGLPSSSPRLAAGLLYTLWEFASREYVSAIPKHESSCEVPTSPAS